MSKLGLLQVHELRNFPPSCLNRDGDNQAKVAYFGDTLRGRISSQCKKRVMRKDFCDKFENHIVGIPQTDITCKLHESYATKDIGELVLSYFFDEGVVDRDDEATITDLRSKDWFGSFKGDKKPVMMKWGWADVEAVITCTCDRLQKTSVYLDGLSYKQKLGIISKDKKADDDLKVLKNKVDKEAYLNSNHNLLVKLFNSLSLKEQLSYTADLREVAFDIALFGRMSTIKSLSNVEAALSISHAISTNKVRQEDDFFIAVDDLVEKGILKDDDGDEQKGAGHLNETSYNSCCYYTYYSVDLDLLVENLTKHTVKEDYNEEEFREELRQLLKTIFDTVPTGKSKGFGTCGVRPQYMVFERIKDKRPVNYINAFEKPVSYSAGESLVEKSIKRLNDTIVKMDRHAGFNGDRVICSPDFTGNITSVEGSTVYINIDEAIESILATIK